MGNWKCLRTTLRAADDDEDVGPEGRRRVLNAVTIRRGFLMAAVAFRTLRPRIQAHPPARRSRLWVRSRSLEEHARLPALQRRLDHGGPPSRPLARLPARPLPLGACAATLLPTAAALGQVTNLVPPDVATRLLEGPRPPAFVPGEVIVKLRDGTVSRSLPGETVTPLGLQQSARRTSGGELIYRVAPTTLLGLGSREAAERRLSDIVAELSARADVEYAQPNWIVRPLATPNDPAFPRQWHYQTNGTGAGQSPGGINLPKAWDTTKGDLSVVVAVIDTGILPDHADITGSANLTAGYDMISDPFIGDDGDGRDNDPTDPGDAVPPTSSTRARRRQ